MARKIGRLLHMSFIELYILPPALTSLIEPSAIPEFTLEFPKETEIRLFAWYLKLKSQLF